MKRWFQKRRFFAGAILLYLAEKTGQFLPAEPRAKIACMEWLFFQVRCGGFGLTLQCRFIRKPNTCQDRLGANTLQCSCTQKRPAVSSSYEPNQVGGFGPIPGQAHHFLGQDEEHQERNAYSVNRYLTETKRL